MADDKDQDEVTIVNYGRDPVSIELKMNGTKTTATLQPGRGSFPAGTKLVTKHDFVKLLGEAAEPMPQVREAENLKVTTAKIKSEGK